MARCLTSQGAKKEGKHACGAMPIGSRRESGAWKESVMLFLEMRLLHVRVGKQWWLGGSRKGREELSRKRLGWPMTAVLQALAKVCLWLFIQSANQITLPQALSCPSFVCR